MRKRKSPVVLITILIIMLVAVGIIYAPRGETSAEEVAQQQPPPPTAEKGERPKISANEVASMANASMSTNPSLNRAVEMGDSKPGSKPSIAVPPQANPKPVPNDTSTSTQWYTNETKK